MAKKNLLFVVTTPDTEKMEELLQRQFSDTEFQPYLIGPCNATSKSLDNVAERLSSDGFKMAFVDGALGYFTNFRKSMETRGVKDLPLLVSDPLYAADLSAYSPRPAHYNLAVSGCDFGVKTITRPTIVAQHLSGDVTPADWLVFNPVRYRDACGVILPADGNVPVCRASSLIHTFISF